MAVLSKPESQDVVPQGWEEPVVAPYLPKAGSPVPSRSVALIGTYADGLNIPGKVTAGLFFPIFDYVLRQFDARVACYENADDFVQADTTDFAGIAILVYREALDDLNAVQEAERRILAKHPDALVVDPAELGRTLGNKILTRAVTGLVAKQSRRWDRTLARVQWVRWRLDVRRDSRKSLDVGLWVAKRGAG